MTDPVERHAEDLELELRVLRAELARVKAERDGFLSALNTQMQLELYDIDEFRSELARVKAELTRVKAERDEIRLTCAQRHPERRVGRLVRVVTDFLFCLVAIPVLVIYLFVSERIYNWRNPKN